MTEESAVEGSTFAFVSPKYGHHEDNHVIDMKKEEEIPEKNSYFNKFHEVKKKSKALFIRTNKKPVLGSSIAKSRAINHAEYLAQEVTPPV